MALLFASTFGFCFILLLLLYKYYLYYKKKLEGFPFMNTWSYILHSQVSGKITKDKPVNHVLFEKLIRTCKQYSEEGLFMTFWDQPVLFIYKPEAIKFFTNEKAAKDKSSEYHLLEEAMGAGIDTSNGERWRSHRKVINPAFNLRLLSKKIPIFNEHAMALVRDMEKYAGKPCVSLLEILKPHYFKSIFEFLMGLKQTEENTEVLKLSKYVDTLAEIIVMRMCYPWLYSKFTFHLFPSGRKFYNCLKKCDDFINQVILAMKESITANKIKDGEQSDFSKSLTYMLLNHHMKDSTFTIKDVHDEVKTILSAGYDTVSYTTMWCLFLLGLHPEIQEKVFSEIQSKTSDYITHEELNYLTYLEAVVKETLRLYTTVPIYFRSLTEDVQYEKYKVHKGTTIAFFPQMLHRNPKLYPDPDEFKPERFLNEDLQTTSSFIPFAEGIRTCIGKNVAMLEVKIFLAHILRNFKFISLDKKEDVKLSWSIVVSPSKPLRMQIKKRSS